MSIFFNKQKENPRRGFSCYPYIKVLGLQLVRDNRQLQCEH